MRTVSTPAGKCPAKLSGTDRTSVMEWADRVMEFGVKDNCRYLPEAIRYWARDFYDYFSPEYKAVCQIITEELGPGTVHPKVDYYSTPATSPSYKEKEKPVVVPGVDSFIVGEVDEDDEDDEDIKL